MLNELDRLLKAATAGPWLCDEGGWPVRFPVEGQGHIPYWSSGLDDSPNNPYRPHSISFPTLDFIVAARNHLPALLALVKQQHDALGVCTEQLRRVQHRGYRGVVAADGPGVEQHGSVEDSDAAAERQARAALTAYEKAL